jgi:hypothetical protein
MKTKYIIRCVFALFLLILGNGCVTHALWQNDKLEAWNEPAPDPNLRIFASQPHGDMLIVYDESSGRSGVTHARAFWLNENEELLEQRRIPHFISTNSVSSLTPIPVIAVTTNHIDYPPPPYARFESDQQSFTLFLADQNQAGPYKLPVYNDGKGKVEKLALTPLANVADATLVAGFLGVLYLWGMSGGGGYPYQ